MNLRRHEMALPGNIEWFVIIAVVLLLFGGSQIPKLARSLGRARGEFQKSKSDFERELSAGERDAQSASEARVEENIRKTAADLGIPVDGRSLDDIKRDLNEKLS